MRLVDRGLQGLDVAVARHRRSRDRVDAGISRGDRLLVQLRDGIAVDLEVAPVVLVVLRRRPRLP